MFQDRRQFLQGLMVAGVAGRVLAQTGPAIVKLTDKLTLITGAGNNIVSMAGDGGALLVDCGDAAHAQDVLKMVGGKVQSVINTHWHVDSTGANDAMAKAGAKLTSHVNTQLWMTQEIIHDWENKTYAPRAKEAMPTDTFYTSKKMTFAGEPIEIALMTQAHTDGDVYVHFTQQNVVVAGDVLQPGRLPVLDFTTGGWWGGPAGDPRYGDTGTGILGAQRRMLQLGNDDTKFIPAVGAPMTKKEIEAQFATLTKLRDSLVALMKKGMGARDMINAKATKDFPELAGDPEQFLYTSYRALWAHVRELGGIV